MALFITTVRTGGGKTFVKKVCKAFPPGSVKLCVLRERGTAQTMCRQLEIIYDSIFTFGNLFNPSILVISNSQICALIGALMFPWRHCYVTHGFGSAIEYLPKWRRLLWLIQCNIPGTRLVACGPSEFRAISKSTIWKRSVIRVNNGFEFDSYMRKRSYNIQGTARLVFIGRISFQKGIDVLLSAMGGVQPGSAELTIIGQVQESERCYFESLDAVAKRARVQIRFVGEQVVTNETFEAYDALVFPSRFEGLPYLLLEAANAGIPVICSDCNGARDVVASDDYAFVHKSEDADDLVRVINEFLGATPADRMGRASRLREYARREFSDASFRAAYARLF